jgi:glutamate dehydrogenase (NAD(P)+)
MRVIDLTDDQSGLEAFVVIDHELFPMSAGGTRMLPDIDVHEIARLARAMTWKFAAQRVPYAGAKAGIRFGGGHRAAVLTAYKRALEPYRQVFLTGPDMGTSADDFLDERRGPLPLWARTHEGLGMDDLATGHGVKAAAEAALAHLGRSLEGAAVAIEGFGKVGAGTARAANIPYGAGAVKILHRREIVAVPDFLSNAGAVHLFETLAQDEEPAAGIAAIERAVGESVAKTLTASAELGITPLEAALREARDYLAEATGAPAKLLDELIPT